MGKHADAQVHYEKALEQNDKYVPARIHLGLLLLRLGDKNGAKDQWTSALEVDPSNRSAKMYLRTFMKDQDMGELNLDIDVDHDDNKDKPEED
jgi:tetratricopeptide (TPR) repeat protein